MVSVSPLAWTGIYFILLILATTYKDAYVYLMYVRMCLEIFIPIWILSWAILLPLDAVGTRSGVSDTSEAASGFK